MSINYKWAAMIGGVAAAAAVSPARAVKGRVSGRRQQADRRSCKAWPDPRKIQRDAGQGWAKLWRITARLRPKPRSML